MKLPTVAPGGDTTVEFKSFASFGWDQDGYSTEPNFVYVYITSGVDGVGDIKERVSCDFTTSSFDLKVIGLNGKNLRLNKTNLEKEILPEESKVIVKKNMLKVKMRKKKGQYGYDQWMDLVAKRAKTNEDGSARDPGADLMDMMKDMYDNGDDNMRKALGEAMMKSRQQQQRGEMPGSGMDDDASLS